MNTRQILDSGKRHSLRRTGWRTFSSFQLIYLRNHGNLKCLQEMLGHADIQTTMKYADALGPEAMIEDHQKASPVDNLLRK